MTVITFGSDPEIFLVEKGTRNLVPPEYLIHFKGLNPIRIDTNSSNIRHPVFVENKDFSIIGDGALFEFILTPSEDIMVMYNRFLLAMESLHEIANKFNLDVLHSPIADFNVKKYFEDMKEDVVKLSTIAGCDPDEDAIDDNYESKIRSLTQWVKRGAGGHIHLGVKNYPLLHEDVIPAIKLMAITVGNTYIKNVVDLKSEQERQEVFGKAGRYRIQNYSGDILGIEYRTPSNVWLLSEESVNEIAEACRKAIHYLRNPKIGATVIEEHLDDTVDAIHNVDINLATNILKEVM